MKRLIALIFILKTSLAISSPLTQQVMQPEQARLVLTQKLIQEIELHPVLLMASQFALGLNDMKNATSSGAKAVASGLLILSQPETAPVTYFTTAYAASKTVYKLNSARKKFAWAKYAFDVNATRACLMEFPGSEKSIAPQKLSMFTLSTSSTCHQNDAGKCD